MKIQFIPGKPIATTNFNQAKPLGVNGQLVLENWRVLYDLLKNKVGPECAALLLEPQLDRGRGEVDWYLPADCQTLPVQSLSKEENLQKAHVYLEQGQQLAHHLLNSSEPAQRQKGRLLLEALQFPNEDSIIATPYGPALIEWGHESNQVLSTEEVISAKGKDSNKRVMIIVPPPASPFKNQITFKNIWPWIVSILILFLLLLLPWWQGLIPIVNYCRYYWLIPFILLLLTLPIIALLFRNGNHHAPLMNKGKV